MPLTLDAVLQQISWHECQLQLAPARNIGRASHALVVLNALLKSVKVGVDDNPERPRVKRTFHVPNRPAHRLYLPAGEPFHLNVLFTGASDSDIEAWLNAFAAYLKDEGKAGFQMVSAPQWQRRHGLELLGTSSIEDAGSAELELLSPLPFHRPKGSSRTALKAEQFFELLSKRIKSLFGMTVPLPSCEHITLLSNYWHYFEIHHTSKSQPGNTQYYNGCVGSLYFSGQLKPLLPWLCLASVFHVSGSVALNPLGYARLHCPARPRLDRQWQDQARWAACIQELQEESDDWAHLMVEQFGGPLDPSRLSAVLIERISHMDWQPNPSMSFMVPKRGGLRRLEKLPPVERLVHAVLHEMLSEPIDRVLEPAAVGFRRGRSTQMVLQQVQTLLQEGYRFVVESDVEDFFPSVDLGRLEQELDHILPPSDLRIRQLLHKLLNASWLDGTKLCSRTTGLAQGSPLSPLLANLYLDRFDEILSQTNGQLVRYADDFIILTRTREDAESLLDLARQELGKVGLSLGEDKTAIVDIERGFRFLGQPFGGEAYAQATEIFAVPSKKSVYITEPGAMLGHNGDALEIRHQGQPITTLPFRRISDIIVLDHASFSSGLVRKCTQHNVPLIFTLGSGYHVATVAPDSRRHFGVSERQALHYAGLSATERLLLAKSFASQKILNYQPLLRSRYAPGTSQLLAELDDIIAGLEMAPGVPEVRGHEGRAARLVFQALNSFIKVPEFEFSKRLRDKPDRMNCLFNFGYYLLFSRLNTMVRAVGLNPYLGFLHDGEDNYETLVCDVQELFRSAVDRMLIALVNLRVISADDFRVGDKGLRLESAAIKRLIDRFEHMLHSDMGGLTLLRTMEAQVKALRNHVSDGHPMWYFRYPDSTRSSRPVEEA